LVNYRSSPSGLIGLAQTSGIPVEHIARSILVLRGQRVLLDAELAALYGVCDLKAGARTRLHRSAARSALPPI